MEWSAARTVHTLTEKSCSLGMGERRDSAKRSEGPATRDPVRRASPDAGNRWKFLFQYLQCNSLCAPNLSKYERRTSTGRELRKVGKLKSVAYRIKKLATRNPRFYENLPTNLEIVTNDKTFYIRLKILLIAN